MGDRDRWLGVGAMVLIVLIYASNFVATRYSVHNGLSAHDLVALRFGIAGVLLLPYFCRLGLRDLAGLGWGRALILATIAGSPYLLLFITALSMAPASHGAVLNPGVVPSVVFVSMVVLGLQRFSWWRAGSLLLIVLGLVLVTAASFSARGPVLLGDGLLFLTGISWGIFTLLARLWRLSPMQAAAIVSVISMAYLPFYLAFFYDGFAAASLTHIVAQSIYQGIVNSVITLYLLTYALLRLGAQATSLFSPLVPVLTTLLAVPFLGEIPSTIQWTGILVVVAGMLCAARTPGRRG